MRSQDPLDLFVRPRNHVHGDELANAARRRGAGIGGSLHGADVTAHQHRDVARADVFLRDQLDVGRLDHGVRRLDCADQSTSFDESERILRHYGRVRADCTHIAPAATTALSSLSSRESGTTCALVSTSSGSFMLSTRSSVLLSLCALLVAAGCRSKEPDAPPVATPSVSFAHTRVPLGSPVEVTYKFQVAPNAPAFQENYRVMVHFLDADEELMWTDDHDPSVPVHAVEAGPDDRVHADDVRAHLSVRRQGQRARRAVLAEDAEAPVAGGADHRAARVHARVAAAAAALGERVPAVQGRLAPAGDGAGELRRRVAVDEEDGDALVPQPEEGQRLLPARATAPTSSPRRWQ